VSNIRHNQAGDLDITEAFSATSNLVHLQDHMRAHLFITARYICRRFLGAQHTG
jgi:hypothetical protein